MPRLDPALHGRRAQASLDKGQRLQVVTAAAFRLGARAHALNTAARAGGGPVKFTAGEQRRDFVYIDDVAEGILWAAARPGAAGEVLNLGTRVATSVREAVSLAVEISGRLVTAEFGALPSRAELSTLVANTVKTQRILGWVPSTSPAQGLHRFWEEFQRSSAK